MGGSKMPEQMFGVVLKEIYSKVKMLGLLNKRGVGEIKMLNRGARIVE